MGNTFLIDLLCTVGGAVYARVYMEHNQLHMGSSVYPGEEGSNKGRLKWRGGVVWVGKEMVGCQFSDF